MSHLQLRLAAYEEMQDPSCSKQPSDYVFDDLTEKEKEEMESLLRKVPYFICGYSRFRVSIGKEGNTQRLLKGYADMAEIHLRI